MLSKKSPIKVVKKWKSHFWGQKSPSILNEKPKISIEKDRGLGVLPIVTVRHLEYFGRILHQRRPLMFKGKDIWTILGWPHLKMAFNQRDMYDFWQKLRTLWIISSILTNSHVFKLDLLGCILKVWRNFCKNSNFQLLFADWWFRDCVGGILLNALSIF